METVSEHVLEPRIAGPSPRAAYLSFGSNALLTASLLLFTVFLCGGGWALTEAARLGWLAAAGRTVQAQVVAIDTQPSPMPGQPPVQTSLRYQYRLPSVDAAQTAVVLLAAPHPLDSTPLSGIGPAPTRPLPPQIFHVGDPLPLRCAVWPGHPILMLWPADAGLKIVFLALSGSLIVIVSVLLMRRIGGWWQRRLHLLRQGIATVGTVTHKHAQAEDSPRYYVRYGYAWPAPPAAPEHHEHEEQVTAEQWRRLEVGQPVTVLYDPAQPETAGLYMLLRGH